MQSSVITSAISSCCCSSIKALSSSSAGPADGCSSHSALGVRQQGKNLASAIALRADKRFSSERLRHRIRRSDGKVATAVARAGGGGSLDETLKDLNSAGAVEGMQGFDRSARLAVDDLKPVEHEGTSTSPRDLELQAEEKALETDESFGGKEPVLEVASDSAVDPQHAHEHTVATANELAPELGLSVEDLTTSLEDRAEEASNRDSELLKTDKGTGKWDGGVGQAVDVTSQGSGTTTSDEEARGTPGELTREEATEKILDVAREGIEILKWAAEGVMQVGANSREGLEVAKELIDKRLKSLHVAAEETKEVSAQLSDAAKKKYEELQSSTAKFGEELQVQVKDKKATDELKPDSETNPLAQLRRGVEASLDVVTKDSPLAKLGQTLQENVSKLGSAGQESTSRSSSSLSQIDTAERSERDSDRLVPVGEKEGFFQDLAPASGSSPEVGDRSTEASVILGDENVAEEEGKLQGDGEEYEGFFGDIPVGRSASSAQKDAAEEISTTASGNLLSSRGQKEFDEFFGDIPEDPSTSSSEDSTKETLTTAEQTRTMSGDPSATMRSEYEDEVGNDQLKQTEISEGETSSVDPGR